MPENLLQVSNISKSFPGVKALDGVSLHLKRGEILGLVGENGAGKSTLVKILCGAHADYRGTITIDGEPISFKTPRNARDAGIAIIYQELSLIQELSIAENIFLGREPLRYGLIDFDKMNESAQIWLDQVGLGHRPDCPVGRLKVGEQQLVEIAKALSMNARILILDEPTSALSDRETDRLFHMMEKLKKGGTAMIFITHHLQDIFKITERVAVLRDGKSVSKYLTKNVSRRHLISDMVGRDIEEKTRIGANKSDQVVLEVKKLSVAHPISADEYKVHQVGFSLYKGEILGIAGLMGSGRSEILEAIYGAHPRETTGKFFIDKKPVQIKSPSDAIGRGIALVSEDRKRMGLTLGRDIKENLSLAALKHFSCCGMIRSQKEEKEIYSYIHQLKIKCSGITQVVNTLSGGNQQKVVLGKFLMTKPKILLLDEPTRGVDVGAKAEIYDLVRHIADQHISIILVSSDLPEIIALADRVLVMYQGHLSGELIGDSIGKESIMYLATHFGGKEDFGAI